MDDFVEVQKGKFIERKKLFELKSLGVPKRKAWSHIRKDIESSKKIQSLVGKPLKFQEKQKEE